jgi:hypothetical protein
MKRLALVALAVVGFAACGRAKNAAQDGGDAATPDGDAALVGFRSYDVTASLVVTPVRGDAGSGSWTEFPTTFRFTFVWDPATGVGFTGANGRFAKVAIETAGNLTFRLAGSSAWEANEPFDMACDGEGAISLDDVTFSLDGAGLHGKASGKATYQTNATIFEAPTTAEIVGVPDVTPPTFTSLGTAVDPLAGLQLEISSEPLPRESTASLVSTPHGDKVELGPLPLDLLATSVRGFGVPYALRHGETYTLVTDHVADYAGNKPAAPVTFTTRAAPPLVPEDGFESITGTMFGGAGVLRGGPLMPIAGQTSLLLNTGYGGGFGFLPYDLGPSLSVRLAVAPGDTVIRFEEQLIAPDPIDAAFFAGAINFGSVGGIVGSTTNVAGTGFAKVTLPQLGDVYLSPVETLELPLPADAAGEITFEIVGQIGLCDPPPSPTVLVIDNLRTE